MYIRSFISFIQSGLAKVAKSITLKELRKSSFSELHSVASVVKVNEVSLCSNLNSNIDYCFLINE